MKNKVNYLKCLNCGKTAYTYICDRVYEAVDYGSFYEVFNFTNFADFTFAKYSRTINDTICKILGLSVIRKIKVIYACMEKMWNLGILFPGNMQF